MAGAPVGNQNAKKAKLFEGALKRALARKMDGSVNDGLDQVADKLVKYAIDDGLEWAIKMVAERIDGRAPQSIEVLDDRETPTIASEIERARRIAFLFHHIEQKQKEGLTIEGKAEEAA